MADRMLQCPKCRGTGSVMVTIPASGLHGMRAKTVCCPLCNGDLTILDRRKPTATDRAVERIKAYCAKVDVCDSDEACVDCARVVRGIIREEAERHE